MPGLFGYWTHSKGEFQPSNLTHLMAEALQHQPKLKTEMNTYPGFLAGRVHLGYFQPEAQPVTDRMKRFSLWLDGEFNNASKLRRTFDSNNPAKEGDAALALELFLNNGWDFLPEVDGIFAIALYDHKDHELTLVNDRYGLRPLYWVKLPKGFGYAGEVKSLLELPEVAPNIDPLAVKERFSFGYIFENRTWIEGIELLPPATIMQVNAEGIKHQHYWSWSEIKPLSPNVSEDEIVEELARLWCQAVGRSVDGKHVGLPLSGGLDSRAILAALPPTDPPCHTLTFGAYDCDDERIARHASELKGMEHHFVEIKEDNWLLPRIDAIWRTDGLGTIVDLHGAETIPLLMQICDIQLNGYLGDAVIGGSYIPPTDTRTYLKRSILIKNTYGLGMPDALDYMESIHGQVPEFPDSFVVDQRGRRFVITGPLMTSAFVETRMPFMDNNFFTYSYSLGDKLRAKSYIYNKMLLRKFPKFYNDVPWQKTGLPIGAPTWRKQINNTALFTNKAMLYAQRRLGVDFPVKSSGYTNYPMLLRAEPARSFLVDLLLDGNVLYSQYVDADKARIAVNDFLTTRQNKALNIVNLLLSLEIYLLYLFDQERLTSRMETLATPESPIT